VIAEEMSEIFSAIHAVLPIRDFVAGAINEE